MCTVTLPIRSDSALNGTLLSLHSGMEVEAGSLLGVLPFRKDQCQPKARDKSTRRTFQRMLCITLAEKEILASKMDFSNISGRTDYTNTSLPTFGRAGISFWRRRIGFVRLEQDLRIVRSATFAKLQNMWLTDRCYACRIMPQDSGTQLTQLYFQRRQFSRAV